MKKIILPVLVASLIHLKAQHNGISAYGTNFPYFDSEEITWVRILAGDKKIKSVKRNSSKDKDDIYLLVLNESGRIVEKENSYKWKIGLFKKKQYAHEKFIYNGDLTNEVQFYNRKGELSEKYLYQYFVPNRISHSESWKKGKKVFESNAKFNADTNVTEYSSYKVKDGNLKQSIRYEYEYYPDKQRKETRMFNRKNKLKHIWKYECNPKGEIVEKRETQVCRNSGVDNKGRFIETIFNTTSKNWKTKEVHVYYVFNGKKIEVQFENYIIEKGKERKWYEIHFADSVEKYSSYKYYDSKGRVTSESRTDYREYNSKNKIMELKYWHYYSKGKLKIRQEENFNSLGLHTSSTSYGKKDKVLGKVEFEYEGDSKFLIKHYRKNKLSETLTGQIQYY